MNYNSHNQQNEIPKDYSLLRKFDLEAAKRGELLTCIDGTHYYILKSWNTELVGSEELVKSIIVQLINDCDSYEHEVKDFSLLRMLPLCWIEGKPVYKGDVLWRVDNSTGEVTEVTVKSFSENPWGYFLDFDGELDTCLDFSMSTLHWEKPKVKVLKEGWMNIYPSGEYSTFPCENSAIYRTKEIADDCASSNRIDCVKVYWEVEE